MEESPKYLPKHLRPKPDTTRSRSKRQESRIAKDLKGRLTKNSGATFGENDIVTDFCEVEAKTTRRNSYGVSPDEFRKLEKKAKPGLIPVMVIEFEAHKKEFAVIQYEDFLYFIQTLNQEA
jgi:hypothetical protein